MSKVLKSGLCAFAAIFAAIGAFAANVVTTAAELTTALASGGEVMLGADIADADITISKDTVLDLGGKTMTDAAITVSAKVTIKNGFIKNTNEPYPVKVTGSGELTIEGVDIAASKSDRTIWLDGNKSVLNFNSGSILATKGANNSNSKIYGIWVCKGATANINGGKIEVDAGPDATAVAIFGNYDNTVNVTGGKISTSGKNYSYAIWTEGDVNVSGGEIVTNERKYGYSSGITYGKNYAINTKGDVEISGGSITTYGPSGYLVNAGGSNQNVSISDVKFTSVLSETDKTSGEHKEPALINGKSVTASISGGEFSGVSSDLLNKGYDSSSPSALTISGGSFDVAPKSDYIESGTVITVAGQTMTKTENGTLQEANFAAKIGNNKWYVTLQDAVNAVKNGETITLVADCAENVAFTQTKDVSFVIDGNGKTMTGSINITARAGKDADSTLLIKNFVFTTDKTSHDFIKSVETNYYPNNITIENCSFTGTADINSADYAVVAVRLKSANNILIKDCTGGGLHSFLQNTAGWNVNLDNVDVTGSLSGFAMGTVQGTTIKNCDLTVSGMGVRLDAQYNNNAVLESNKIEAFIPVVVRKASVDSNITVSGDNTMTATNTDNIWFAVGTSEYNENGKLPSAATSKVIVTLNDTGLDAAGVYGNYGVAMVNGVKYFTLKDAVTAVADGGTVTLISSEVFTADNRTYNSGTWYDGLYYVGDKSFTIDLGGFTISQDGAVNDYLLNFKNEGAKANTVTIKNGTIDAGTTAFCAICTSGASTQKVVINLENVTVINNKSDGSTIKMRGGSELNVKAGTKITGKDSYLGIEVIASTANIYDGVEIYMNGTTSYNGCLAGVGGNGTINVYGGYGKGVSGGFIAMTSGGTINVEGGEWIADSGNTGKDGNYSVLIAQSGNGAKSVVNVTGGTFTGKYNCYGDAVGDAQIVISGGNFTVDPTSYVAEGYIVTGTYAVAKPVATIGEQKYATLQEVFNAAVEAKGNVTVDLLENIDLTGKTWRPVAVDPDSFVTVNGNNKTITGLSDMLFASTWAGKSGLVINDLTIADSTIVNDENDAKGSVGVGAFVGYPQASAVVTLNNCHLKNSTVKGGHWTGGLVGMAGGYNGTDGPVFMTLTIDGCSVTGSTITGKGSAGGIIGHGSCSAWTDVIIINSTVSESTITSTGSSNNKAGSVMGTIGAAGQPTTVNGVEKTGGMSVSVTTSGNTVKSADTVITTIYGRQGTDTGILEVAGGSYETNPIEEGVAYAAPIDGFKIEQNADGTYGLKSAFAGEGTEVSPYLIATKEDLIYFRDYVNSGKTKFNAAGVYVALAADIDLAGIDWSVNIGDDCSATFDGIFDGQGHKISNLTSTETAQKGDGYICTGLFGAIYGSAVVKNLTLENVTINTGDFTGNNVGAVVGFAYNCSGSIDSVTVKNVSINAANATGVGAVVGYDYYSPALKIANCTVDGTSINARSYAGGIIGYASTNIQLNSNVVKNLAIINGTGSVGGVAGIMLAGGSASDNAVEKVQLSATGELWANSVGLVAGTITSGHVTVSNTKVVDCAATDIVGGILVEKPTAPIEKVQAKVGDTYYTKFEAAFAATKGGDTLTLLADVAADVTVAQAPDTVITIDGNGRTWAGTITVDGKSAAYPAAGLTIKNVNFNATGISKEASINLGVSGNNNTRYVSNLTVENCTFTGAGQEKAAIKSYTGGDKNLVVKGCTVDNTMHSLLQATNIAGVTIDDCEVYSKNGINLNSSSDVEIKDSTVEVSGYAVRAGVSGGTSGKVTLTGNTLKTDNSEGDAVIVIRGSAQNQADLDISKNVIEGATHISGVTDATDIDVEANFWGEGLKAPVVAGTTVDVTTYYKDRELTDLGYFDPAVVIGTKEYASLADAIAAVKNGETITLVKDCGESVTISQKANVKFTIDGAGKTYTGTMTVTDGQGKSTAALTIQNVNFVSSVDNRVIITVDPANNLTVDNCSFTGNGTGYGIKLADADNKNIVVKNTTGTKLFELVYANKAVSGFTAENVTVTDVTYGFFISYGKNLTFKNVNVSAEVGGIAVNNYNASNATFEDCTVTAKWPIYMQSKSDVNDFTLNFNGSNALTSTDDGDLIVVESSKAAFKVVSNDAGLDMSKSSGFVAKTGNVYCTTLQEAIDAATDGDTVTVLRDISVTDAATLLDVNGVSVKCLFSVNGKSITLDLNGKTIAVDYQRTDGPHVSVFCVEDGASMTVTGNGAVNVTADTVTTKIAYLFWKRGSTGMLTVENGVYRVNDAADSIIYTNGDKIVEVKGGTFILDEYGANGNGFPCIFNAQGNYEKQITVTGGSYNADISHQTSNPREVLVPRAYALKKDSSGMWTVVDAVAYVTEYFYPMTKDVGYATFDEAVAAAEKSGGVMTILAGTYNENLNVNKAVAVVGQTDAEGNNLVSFNGKLNVTADGATVKNINVNNGSGNAGYISAKDVLIEGCTIVGGNGFRYCYTSGTVTFKDSTITGSTYGIHFDGNAGGNIVIDNCVITGWTSFAGTIENVKINDSEFASGNYNVLRFYQNADISNTVFAEGMRIDSGSGGMGMNGIDIKIADCSVKDGSDIENVIPAGVIIKSNVYLDGEMLKRVAIIGDRYYATLEDAVAAAGENDVIVVREDIELSETFAIPAGKSVVLDLNGKTISRTHGAEYAMIHVLNSAGLAVVDSVGGGKITYAAGGNNVGAAVWVEGSLTLESGIIEVAGTWNLGFAVDVRPNAWGKAYAQPATFTMNGGKIVSSDTAVRVASNSSDAYADLGVCFTMNGGEIESAWDAIFIQHLYADYLNVTVKDGSVKGSNSALRIYGDVLSDVDLVVENGRFAGEMKNLTATGDGQTVFCGGTYSVDVSDFCAEGYKCDANGDGTYGVVPCGKVMYKAPGGTLQFRDELLQVADGYTVKLLADVEMTKDVVLVRKGANVTLDLNGKTLTNNFKLSSKGFLTVFANGGDIEGTGTLEPDGTEPFAEVAPAVIADKSIKVNCPAGAVQEDFSETQTITRFVLATVDGENYSDIREAVEAALASGKDLVLKADVELDGAISVKSGESLSMDLEDNTLSGDVADGALIVNDGELSLTGGKVDNTDTGRNVVDVQNNSVIYVNGTDIGKLVDETKVAVVEKADGAKVSCQTLADAVSRAAEGDTVKLLKSVSIDSMIQVMKAITVDLGGNTVTASSKKAFEVHANATIKNGTIEAANRCVDTRKNVELTLVDLTLKADAYTSYGNPQPITIGGSDNGTKVAMENVTVNAGIAGYGIITFVETELAATNCTIAGYGALYVKPGSENSVFDFVNCDLSASMGGNDVAGNSFSVIAIQTDNVKVNVDADSTVKAEGSYMDAISLGYEGDLEVEGNEIVVAGVIEGNILATDCASKNTVAVKADYTDALEAEGYAVEAVENGMVKVLGPKVAEVNGVAYISLEAAVAVALDGDEVKILKEGVYKVPSGKNITITGAVEGVEFDMSKAVGVNASMTFNNVTFEYGNANYVGLQHSGNLVYNNCTINGQVFLYGQSETFNKCTFNQNSASAYNVWTYGAQEVAFNECTFNSAGKSVLIYAEGASIFNNVTVTKSTFNATSAVDGKAAIEMDSSLTAGINLTIDGETTAVGFAMGNVSGNSLWNNKKGNNTDDNNDITVVVEGVTVLEPLNFVAYVGKVGYTTITDAINGAQDGDTVEIVAGTFDEKIAPWASDPTHAVEKSITIVGADNFGTVLTGGLYVGYDDSGCRENTVVVKGIAFEGKGVLVAGQQNVVIEGNRFTNIMAPVATTGSATANAISVIGKNVNATVMNNEIDTVASVGIMLRNVATAQVMGNTVANTQHNSIQITAQTGCTASDVLVANNNLSNWGLGGEGRAMRISGIVNVAVTGNVMSHTEAPEQFVKVTGTTAIDASANYWNGADPTGFDAWNFDKDTDPALTLKSYYTDVEKTNLVALAPAVAKIGKIYYRTFADALAVVQDGETVELCNVAADEHNVELEFDRAISFTITGTAPEYKAPVITFQNATVTIKDAEFQIPELDARQNATINVVDSTLVDAGDNSIVKSYYNGAINILGSSVVYTMQLTTMGYIKIADTAQVHATWQSNIYGNGLVVVEGDAQLNTAALHLTGKDYSGRDNTDEDRVGKPAQITVDGATLVVGKVKSFGGSDYSYNSSKGINIGTIEGKCGVLDVKNGATVEIYQSNGNAVTVGAGGTLNVAGSTLNVAVRGSGEVVMTNKGTVTVDGDSAVTLDKVTLDVYGVLESEGDITGGIAANAGAEIALSGGTYTQDVAEWCVAGYASVANGDGTWTVTVLPEYGLVEDGRGVVMTDLVVPDTVGVMVDKAFLDVAVKLEKPAVSEVFSSYNLDLYVTVTGLPSEGVVCGEDDYLAGDFGPAGKLFLSLDGVELTNGMTIPVLALADETLTYGEVLEHSGDFRCGIHLGDSMVDGLAVTFTAGLEKNGVFSQLGDALSFDLTYSGAVAIIVAEDGEYGPYYTVAEALAEAYDGETVKLLTDASEKVVVPDGLEVIIDLNGKTLNGSILAPNADLTVKNGAIVNTDASASALEINAGTLVLVDVNVDSAHYAVNVPAGANATIYSGNYTSENGSTLAAVGSLTVTGGTFDQDPGAYLPAGYESYGAASGFGVMKRIALDIKVVDGMPVVGYDETVVTDGGKLVLKAVTTLDGSETWTTVTYTKDAELSTSDAVKDWVAPAEGYQFFKGGVAK